ncbi:hypothetical protein DVR14_07235 [Natrinema thermotolerans]|nr:hypothetical protein DVR14_07235 [Natrinema thermotolerans]
MIAHSRGWGSKLENVTKTETAGYLVEERPGTHRERTAPSPPDDAYRLRQGGQTTVDGSIPGRVIPTGYWPPPVRRYPL